MARESDGLIFRAQALTRAWAMKIKQTKIDKIVLECWECKDCMTLEEHLKKCVKPLSINKSV